MLQTALMGFSIQAKRHFMSRSATYLKNVTKTSRTKETFPSQEHNHLGPKPPWN